MNTTDLVSKAVGCSIATSRRSRRVAALGSLLVLSTPVWAAQPAASDDGTLEEVIVTAQYREENLQDTPLSITAVTAEKLEAQGITNVSDLGLIIPNANIRQQGGFAGPTAQVGMRGVDSTSIYFNFQPGVGVYVDDVYHGTLTGSAMDLLDLERIEVLRGPQGTLFGKNSLGGSIRMISKKPRGDDTGNVELTYGTAHRLDLKASYDFSLAENLFMRLSGVSKQIDGYQDILDFACQMRANGTPALAGRLPTQVPSDRQNNGNCKIGEKGGSELNAGRAQFRYVPSESTEYNLALDYSKSVAQPNPDSLLRGHNPSTAPGQVHGAFSNNVIFPLFGIRYTDDRFVTGDPFTTYGDGNDPRLGRRWPKDATTNAWSATGSADYALSEALQLKFVAAYRTYDLDFLGDGDLIPLDLNQTYNVQEHEQTTFEARLSGALFNDRLDWTAGAYYFNAESHLGGFVTFGAFAAFIPDFAQNDDFSDESVSGFLHGTFSLTDALTVNAGVRYTDESKVYEFDHGPNLIPTGPLPYGGSNVDWKASLDYRLNPNLMVYGSVSTGFRSDAVQPQPFVSNQIQPLTGEEIIAYEVGVKSDFFNRRLRINAAAFLNDYDPKLQSQFGGQCEPATAADPGRLWIGIQTCPPGTGLAGGAPLLWFGYISAPGKATGLEFEVSASPVNNLDINATFGYFDYESSLDRGQPGFIDPTVRSQPEFSYSAGAQYRFALGNGGSVVPRIDWFHQGERTNGAIDTVQVSPVDIVPDYDLFNARLTYMAPDGKWNASLSAENLFDKFYWVSIGTDRLIQGAPAYNRSGVPGRGREIALSVRRNF